MIEGFALSALNHLLAQAAWARQKLSAFAGRRARFVMPPWQLAFAVSAEGLFEPSRDEADVTVSLPADGPFLALQGMDRLMAEAHVTGNAEFATALSFVLKNLRWDAEEDLSRLVGDIAAHRIARGVASAAAWQKQAATNLAENVSEYLTEENRTLVRSKELAALAEDLRTFEDDLKRLEGRLNRIA